MARTAEVVQGEYDALRAAKVHHLSSECTALRNELKDLGAWKSKSPRKPRKKAEKPAKAPSAAQNVVPVENFAVNAAEPSEAPSDPFEDQEWAFIEKTIQNMELSQGSGRYKQIYQELMFRLDTWRRARDIILERGVGAKWPPFSKLGLDPNTGLPLEPKISPKKPVPAEEMMPLVEREVPNNGPTANDLLIANVTGGMDPRAFVTSQVSDRPEPERVLETETADV